MTDLLFIDFETYVSRREAYSLSVVTETEYIRSPLFKAHGCGFQLNQGKPFWVSGKELPTYFKTLDWGKIIVVAHNCIPVTSQVYTKDGWVSLSDVAVGQEILQWDSSSSNLSFSPIQAKIEKTAGEVLSWDSTYHKCSYTPDHRVFYSTPDVSEWCCSTADKVARLGGNNTYIPVSGLFCGDKSLEHFTEMDGRLVEAIRADGRIDGSYVRFHLKKARKIERLRTLATNLGITTSVKEYKDGTFSVSLLNSPALRKILGIFRNGKKYTSGIINYPLSFRRAILDEGRYWDGHGYSETSGYQLTTVCDETAESLELMAHVSGYSVSRRKKQNHNGWDSTSKNINWITIRNKNRVKIGGKATVVKGDFAVGCVTVSSGAFLVRSEGRVFITGNCKFDGSILEWVYGARPRAYLDTRAMAMAVLGSSVASFSLRDLSEYFKLPSKGEMKTDGLLDLTADQEKELAEYCLRDVEICSGIFNILNKQIPVNQFKLMDWTAKCFIRPKLVIDSSLAEKIRDENIAKREDTLEKLGIDASVLSSNKQFAELLKAKDFPVPMKVSPTTGKMIPALALGDVDFQEMLATSDGELKDILEARVVVKSNLVRTRSDKLASIGRTGPYPFDIVFSGATQTHRFSGGGGGGGNPQNLPRGAGLRSCIQAPNGHTLVVADFSAIELRVLAWLSQDTKLIRGILNKEDLYSEYASKFYGRKITKENVEERRFGKCAQLGLGYCMGWEKFSRTVKLKLGQTLDEKTSRAAIELYRNTYAFVPLLWQQCERWLLNIGGKGRSQMSYGPRLVFDKERVVLPSGLELKYPGLAARAGKYGRLEWSFKKFKTRSTVQDEVKIYGGSLTENLCIAEGTEVLTHNGWKKIENVLVSDLLWDGVEWVQHEGLVYKGEKEVIDVYGIKTTPEHEILTERGWKPALECEGLVRDNCRPPEGYESSW